MNEQMSETGMVMQMMKVARQRPRKAITTSTTKMKARNFLKKVSPPPPQYLHILSTFSA